MNAPPPATHLWLDGAHHAAWNMEADAALLRMLGGGGVDTLPRAVLRIYGWAAPAVSFGMSQTPPEGIPENYEVVRRPTGGGVVWHDRDLTYTLAVGAEQALAQMGVAESYALMHARLRDALGVAGLALLREAARDPSPRTMRCFASPSRHDIMDAEGRKIAGAAELRNRDGLLVQGSVLLSAAGGDRARLVRAVAAAFCAAPPLPFTPPQGLFARGGG